MNNRTNLQNYWICFPSTAVILFIWLSYPQYKIKITMVESIGQRSPEVFRVPEFVRNLFYGGLF